MTDNTILNINLENLSLSETKPKVKKCVFKNEKIVKNIFERLLGVKFTKRRCIFSNKKLELDGYCDSCGPNSEFKIGFEYQGQQHYKYIPYFHGENPIVGKELLRQQQNRDQIKRDECKELGIHLVEVPFSVNDKEKFIRSELDIIFGSQGIRDWECMEIILDSSDEEEEMCPVTCEYCNNDFKNNTVLKTHQRTTKYCLLLRDEPLKGYLCQYCSRVFMTKNRITSHEKICKLSSDNKTSEEYQKEIFKLNEQVSLMGKMIDSLNDRLNDANKERTELRDVLRELYIQDINNTPDIPEIFAENMEPLNLLENHVKNVCEKLTIKDLAENADSIALFLKVNLLTDKYQILKYVCVDQPERTFRYKDVNNIFHDDEKCTNLFDHIYDILQDNIKRIIIEAQNSGNQVCFNYEKEFNNSRFKSELIGNIATYTILQQWY